MRFASQEKLVEHIRKNHHALIKTKQAYSRLQKLHKTMIEDHIKKDRSRKPKFRKRCLALAHREHVEFIARIIGLQKQRMDAKIEFETSRMLLTALKARNKHSKNKWRNA